MFRALLIATLLMLVSAPLPAAEEWKPTDAPESVAALADLGPTRWKDANGDIWYISLYGPQVTDKALTHLKGLTKLTNIDLIRSGVTDAGMAELAKLSAITSVNLAYTTVGDAGLAHLAKLKNLRSLNLSHTQVTDAGLAGLGDLKGIQNLDLAGTHIGNAGLETIKAHAALRNLSLDGTQVTDAGMESLVALKRLRTLSLDNTAVTAKGIARLQRALPECQVMRATSGALGLKQPGPRQIVVAADAHPAVKYAAEELQRFYSQATGVQLPIAAEAASGGGHFYIGTSDALSKSSLKIDTTGLGQEDLRIRVRGPEIALVGGGPRGTLYAVYTFLEDVLGIRFLTAEQTNVPRFDPAALPPELDKTFRPPFAYRFTYYKQNMRDAQFGARMRNNVYHQERFGGSARSGLVGHSMEQFVPTAKYGKTHPEYFALVGGKRRCDVENLDSSPKGTQLCLTNPDVRRLIVSGVVESLKKNPKQELISVGHSDNYFYCRCENCEAVNDREASTMGTMLQVVNEAAEAIAKDHPNTYIGTYAYQITRRPPKYLRPLPNVVLQFATIEACQMHGIPDPHCPRNAELYADMKAWQRLTRQLFLWNYNTVFPDYMLPCPNLYNVEPNVRLFAEVGSPGAFMQCCAEGEGTDLAELRNYLICNLMWDPSRSGEKLIDEFLTLHYGPAADAMRRWIALSHDPKRLRDFHCHPFGGPEKYGITPELGAQGIAILDKAIADTSDPLIQERLERVLVAPLRATIYPAVNAQRGNHDKPANEQKPLDPRIARQLRPNLERFYKICEKYGATHVGEARPLAEERKEMTELFANAGAPLHLRMKQSSEKASGGR